jgi:hypothetical protein
VSKKAQREAEHDRSFIDALVNLHERAHRLGFNRTGHYLHAAVQAVGYEAAERLANRTRAGQQEASSSDG